MALFGVTGSAGAQDSGVPDTLYVEVYPLDSVTAGLVRVPLYVTHDIVDSVAGSMISLCWHLAAPAIYCSTSGWWNNARLYPSSDRE
jgi:hypothetical protein